jgi:putative ABC transport system permease protein
MNRLRSTFARALRLDLRSSLAAVVTLIIGVGAVSAIFGVVHGVLLKPLPMREQDRVVVLRKEQLGGSETLLPFAVADLRAFAEETQALEDLAGFQYDGAWPSTFLIGEQRVAARSAIVSGAFFHVLDVRPVVGRVLTTEDDVVGGERVAVISEGLWRREFGGDAGIVGRVLRTGNRGAVRIVGVVPGFELPARTEMWTPTLVALPQAATDRAVAPYNLVGRLRPGATGEQARAELFAFLERQEPVPGEPRDVRASVHPIESLIVGEVRPALLVLAAGVALLMALATVNVANLFLLRALERRRELAVRVAIGAGHWHIVLQLASEGLVVGFLGGCGGLLVACGLLRGLVALAPPELPRLDEIGIDPNIAAAAAATALASALLSSFLPAAAIARRDLSRHLHASGSYGSSDRSSGRIGGVLVVAQVAIATVVLVGAGLLVRTLANLQSLDMGFVAEELSMVGLDLPAEVAASRARTQSFYERAVAGLEGRPGIAAATFVLLPPFSGLNGWDASYTVEGQGAAEAAENPSLDLQPVLPGHFRTLGIPIRRGRAIGADDREGMNSVIVIGEALARRAWPGQDPIGKRLKLGPVDAPLPWRTVVGVVGDVRYRELTSPRPVVYAAWTQTSLPPLGLLVVRGPRGGLASLARVRSALSEAEPLVLVTEVSSIRQRIAVSLARPRFNAIVLAAVAAVALTVAAIGIYAMMAALVRRRQREIGIRVAVGAAPAVVRRMVLGRGLLLGGLGVGAGLAAGLPAARLMSSVLYDVTPADSLTAAATAGILLVVAGLGCHLPARTATRLDPMIVLRSE